jgi:uncharacterized metal-binding protein
MPSGRTHDRITLWSLPIVAGIVFERTRNGSLTLAIVGGFLFSGLMFGPDLDVHSQQYKRWGLLRWIWLPYRKALKHRSVWSHGAIIGTLGRVIYLLVWLSLAAAVVIGLGALAYHILGWTTDAWQLAQQWGMSVYQLVESSLRLHTPEWLGLAIGLEVGALSHSLSDWAGSTAKRSRTRQRKAKAARTQDLLPTGMQPLPPDLRQTNQLSVSPPPSPQESLQSIIARAKTPLPPPAPHEPRLPDFKRPN